MKQREERRNSPPANFINKLWPRQREKKNAPSISLFRPSIYFPFLETPPWKQKENWAVKPSFITAI